MKEANENTKIDLSSLSDAQILTLFNVAYCADFTKAIKLPVAGGGEIKVDLMMIGHNHKQRVEGKIDINGNITLKGYGYPKYPRRKRDYFKILEQYLSKSQKIKGGIKGTADTPAVLDLLEEKDINKTKAESKTQLFWYPSRPDAYGDGEIIYGHISYYINDVNKHNPIAGIGYNNAYTEDTKYQKRFNNLDKARKWVEETIFEYFEDLLYNLDDQLVKVNPDEDNKPIGLINGLGTKEDVELLTKSCKTISPIKELQLENDMILLFNMKGETLTTETANELSKDVTALTGVKSLVIDKSTELTILRKAMPYKFGTTGTE